MGLFHKKHKNTKRLEEFFRKGFKKEIRTLMECRSLLEAEEKWYDKGMTLPEKKHYAAFRDALEEKEMEAIRFMESYDFLRRPRTGEMARIAEEASRLMADYRSGPGETAETEDTEKEAEELKPFMENLSACQSTIQDQEMKEKLSVILSSLSGLSSKEGDEAYQEKYRKMQNYYLPTLNKLLDLYIEVQGMQGMNVDQIKLDTHHAADTVITSLRTLSDDAYADAAIDANAEASVLKMVAKRDGLLLPDDFHEGSRTE